MSRSNRSKSASSGNSTKDGVGCAFCTSKLNGSSQAIRCDNCQNWICLACSKIPVSMYNEMTKCDPDISLDYMCKSCKSTKPDLKAIQKTLLEMKCSNDTRLKHVEEGLAALKDSLKETVQEEVDKVRVDLTEKVTDNVASRIKDIVESQLKENEDRKNRSNNIIIFKMPLSKDQDPSVRKEHDLDLLNSLFKSLCPDQGDLNIKACFRLINKHKKRGAPEESEDTNRTVAPPLKVVFNSKEQRRRLLTNSSKTSNLTDPVLKELIIVRDMTPDQRKQSAELQKEKSERERNGEEVEIRYGKCVPVRPRPDGNFRH